MALEGRYENGTVVVGGDARQRFHDARGYGYPLEGNRIALAPVEAAHLLYRGDLDAVVDGDERYSFRGFAAREPGAGFGVRFLVYADLRSRGFYLSPAREPWISNPPDADFVVFARGSGPGDGDVAYDLRVVGERTDVPADALDPGALAVVDEESEITYFEVREPAVTGSTETDLATGADADLLADRVVVWDPPDHLYDRAFFGQPLSGRESDERGALQCSLVESTYLAKRNAIDLEAAAVRERGRAVEGERFDRRLRVYETLRERGVVPKTGFKFGADFRTYADVESVAQLGHSELLVRVITADRVFEPRDLALDVRLAHGVRKTMVFALVPDRSGGDVDAERTDSEPGEGGIEWRSVERLTP